MRQFPGKGEVAVYTLDTRGIVRTVVGIYVDKKFFKRVGRGYRPFEAKNEGVTVFPTHAKATAAVESGKPQVMHCIDRTWRSNWFEDVEILKVLVTTRLNDDGSFYEYLVHDTKGTLKGRRHNLDGFFKTRLKAKNALVQELRKKDSELSDALKSLRSKIHKFVHGREAPESGAVRLKGKASA